MTEKHTLTKQDLKALRKADTIVADYRPGSLISGNNCQLRAIKRDRDEFGERDRTYTVPAPEPRIPRGTREASGYVGHAQYENWQGIAWALKAGDTIFLEWRENNNGYVNAASTDVHGHKEDLAVFECILHVYRSKRHFSFLLAYGVCPHNTAAMVKY